MKKALMVLVCFIAAAGFASAKGFGNKGGMNLPPGKWWKLPNVAGKLALTPQEQEQLDTLHKATRMRMIDLKAGLEKEMLELGDLIDRENLDESACMDQFMKVQDARTNLAVEKFKAVIEVRKILGYERFLKLKELRKQRRGHADRRGRRGPPPGPGMDMAE